MRYGRSVPPPVGSRPHSAGPTVGPGSYAHADGCGSDGALDPITAEGRTYSVVFREDGRTLVVYEVVVPAPPESIATC